MLQFPHEYIRASLQGTYAVVMFRTSPLGAVLSIEKLGIAFLGEGTGVGIVLDESWSSRVRELEPYLAPRRREDVPRLVFVPKGQWSQKTFSLAAPGKTPVAAFTEEVRAMVERGAVVAFPMVVGFAPFK